MTDADIAEYKKSRATVSHDRHGNTRVISIEENLGRGLSPTQVTTVLRPDNTRWYQVSDVDYVNSMGKLTKGKIITVYETNGIFPLGTIFIKDGGEQVFYPTIIEDGNYRYGIDTDPISGSERRAAYSTAEVNPERPVFILQDGIIPLPYVAPTPDARGENTKVNLPAQAVLREGLNIGLFDHQEKLR